MNTFLKLLCFFVLIPRTFLFAQNNRVTLPNGWSLTPAGRSIPLGDLPLNIAVSSSQKFIAVTNNGQSRQSILLIDVKKEKVIDSISISSSWLGLKFSRDEKYLYASGGNENRVLRYSVNDKKLRLADTFKLGKKWPAKISPAGLELDDDAHLLYVVTKENNSLYIFDTDTKKIIRQVNLDAEAYTCLLSPDKKLLYISCWGCDKVLVYDTRVQEINNKISVGDNPNDMCLSADGKYLYVSNSNDNTVSVIETAGEKVIETLNCALYPESLPGSTTNSVALSGDDKTLFVANADNNCLAVFDVSAPGSSSGKGFIPTGWYPTCVRVVGNKIFVSNGKGFSSMPNPKGPNPTNKKQKVIYEGGERAQRTDQYIAGLFKGTLSIIDLPGVKQLANYSREVYANTPYSKQKENGLKTAEKNFLLAKPGDTNGIKYVFYIIKENRTYDQVLGDIKEGNGDSSLVLFGEKITPNQHKLAREFVLLDNFYCEGEVSADGHNWSMGAYATDFLEKNWPSKYGGRGGGSYSGGRRKIANNKGGFIWDHAKRSGVSYRTYGEFADNYKPNIPVLRNHFCPYFSSWDLSIKDTSRFYQWKRDFDSLLAINNVPQLNTIRFPNDHTEGMKVGSPTPFAHVADNDLAVGMFMEYLSSTSIWKRSVVFILEDDAQNGPDHVDAHRSTAYVAGPMIKRKFIDHTPYTTSGILRTIELILHISPMTQYDAGAEPLWRCFTDQWDISPFKSLPPNVNLDKINLSVNGLSRKSATFDFSEEDNIPDAEFTEVIWKGVKGADSEVPAPVRGAFLKVEKKKKDD